MENLLQFDQHPRIKIGSIQNDLNILSLHLEEELEKDLTVDELYDKLVMLKTEIDQLKEY